MCTLEVPVAVIDYIDRARRHCLWRNSDCNAKSKPLVAWNNCTKPKKKGGLGITNLRSQNSYLLLKQYDKFFNQKDVPWVRLLWNTYYSDGKLPQSAKMEGSFWWKDILKLCDLFRAIAKCTINDGKTVLFWQDLWNEKVRKESYPRLFSFAKDKNITAERFILQENPSSLFHLPLSQRAYEEFEVLQVELQNLRNHLQDSNEKDIWSYIWGNNKFSASKLYRYTFRNVHPPRPFIWLWESKCSNKLKVFN